MVDSSKITGGIGGAAQGAKIGSMFAPGVGTAIGAVVGGLAGFLGGGGESAATRMAEIQAREIERSAERNVRQIGLQRDQTLGQARVAIGASNILFSGSPMQQMQGVKNEYAKQIGWAQQKAGMDAYTTRKGGKIAASQITAGGIGTMIQGLGTLGSTFNNHKKPGAT